LSIGQGLKIANWKIRLVGLAVEMESFFANFKVFRVALKE